MYIPPRSFLNQNRSRSSSPSAKFGRKNRNRRNLYSLAAAFFLVALLAAAALLSQADKATRGSSPALEHDLKRLWGWSDGVLEGGATAADWTLRWDVTLSAPSAAEQLVDRLFTDDEGRSLERIVTNEGKTIRGRLPAGGGALTVHETERTNTGVTLLLLLEWRGAERSAGGQSGAERNTGGQSGAERNAGGQNEAERSAGGQSGSGEDKLRDMLAAAGKYTRAAEAEADTVRSGVKLHGFAKTAGAAKQIERLSLGEKVEEYEQEGSRVGTFWSSELMHAQQLDGRRRANLQISAHEHTERAMTELTVGIPLIAGDFGAAPGEEPDWQPDPQLAFD